MALAFGSGIMLELPYRTHVRQRLFLASRMFGFLFERKLHFAFGALVFSLCGLAALFSASGIFGGYLVGVQLIGVDAGSFWSQMQAAVDVRTDILNGVIKSVVFGVAVTWISVFEGYDAVPTAEGVSRATTRTVVTSSLAILALDFVLTALMFTGGNH